MESTESDKGAGLRLAAVQFVFTLGWTVYVVFLPTLLARAGLPANWLPWLLIIDQAIFAIMDIACVSSGSTQSASKYIPVSHQSYYALE